MFYIYIISSTIVALLLIGITYFIPLFLIREFDKITYIKNYKETMKWYKQPLYYIREILTYITLLFSLMIFAIFGLSNPIMKKQFKEVFRRMFVTPLIGIGFSIVLAVGIDKILYILELHLISSISNSIYFLMLFIIIPYYIVLIVKQLINLIKMENKQLEDYKELKEEGFKKKDWVAAILSSSRKEEYIDNYLKVYDTEAEWKESKFTLINYKWYYKLLLIALIIGIILNYIFSFVENELYDMNIITEQGIFIYLGLEIIILYNWIFNETIIYNIVKKIRLSKKMILKLVILIVVSIVSTIIIWPIIFGEGVTYKPESYDYQEYKEEVIHNVQIRKNYLDYNSYEKQQYIFAYSQDFIDDIDELGYIYDSHEYENYNKIFSFAVPLENKKLIEYAESQTRKDYNYYLEIVKQPWRDIHIILIGDPVVKEKYYSGSPIGFKEIYFSLDSEEEKLKIYEDANGKLMVEEAIKGIDKLWSEEMKDRGLE